MHFVSFCRYQNRILFLITLSWSFIGCSLILCGKKHHVDTIRYDNYRIIRFFLVFLVVSSFGEATTNDCPTWPTEKHNCIISYAQNDSPVNAGQAFYNNAFFIPPYIYAFLNDLNLYFLFDFFTLFYLLLLVTLISIWVSSFIL